MSFLGKLFGKSEEGDGPPEMPWDRKPSIYEHIASHVPVDEPRLSEGGDTLPDEERVNAGSRIRWAAGALDDVVSHHMAEGDNDELTEKTVQLVLAYCESPTASTKAELYQHVIEGNTLPLIDPIIETLIGNDQLDHERLYDLAYSFVTEATDREPVKFGTAILGLYRNPENETLFQTLGRHEEFTLFCAVALSNLSDDPEPSLWTLARNVTGWGRIHIVERLAPTENPEIKDWLLREGYRNSVMYEYLAYTCATAGGLLLALSEDVVDRELLTAAGELLCSLIAGGPAECMDDFEDGAICSEIFLRHMEASAEHLDDYIHVNQINGFLSDDESDWEDRQERGWTPQRRQELLESCNRILGRPHWEEQARLALSSEEDRLFHQGNQVAEAFGIDTWEQHRNRLLQDTDDSGRWYQVMSRCNHDRIDDTIALAEQHIDLEKIATGPADEMGLGPRWEAHQCLDFVVQELRKFPGIGARLIEASLRSPVVRNRNMAIAALAEWEEHHWTDSMRTALSMAADLEPDDGARKRMQNVLAGQPLEE